MKRLPATRRNTAGVMVQLWALLLPLGFGGVAVIGQLQGLTAETMGPTDRVSGGVSTVGALMCYWHDQQIGLLNCKIWTGSKFLQAVAAAVSELLQLGGAAYILRGAVRRHQRLPQPW